MAANRASSFALAPLRNAAGIATAALSLDDILTMRIHGPLQALLLAHPKVTGFVKYVVLLVGIHRGAQRLLAPGYLMFLLSPIRNLQKSFQSDVVVSSEHSLSKTIISWLIKNKAFDSAQSLSLVYKSGHLAAENDTTTQYVPEQGSFKAKYEGAVLVFGLTQPVVAETKSQTVPSVSQGRDTSERQIQISCSSIFPGRAMAKIQAFIAHIKIQSEKERQHGKTTTYHACLDKYGATWKFGSEKPSRPLESVSLDEAIKKPLVEDMQTYLSPDDREMYANLGIPHRRGYLFHGPPGTGKTSISCALAGHFNLDVYVISMSNNDLNDETLADLFAELPGRDSMVLLEDIDSAGIGRESMKSHKGKDQGEEEDGQKRGITLSGLLNVIDGPDSVDERVLVMTSNDPNSLDAALVRPGRVDRKVYFGNASAEVAAKLFRHVFTHCSKLSSGEIDEAAAAFAARVPANKLTPAELQNYIMSHRDDSAAAIAGIEDAASAILEAKENGANVSEDCVDNTLSRRYRDIEEELSPLFKPEDEDLLRRLREDGTIPRRRSTSEDEPQPRVRQSSNYRPDARRVLRNAHHGSLNSDPGAEVCEPLALAMLMEEQEKGAMIQRLS